MVAGIHVNSPEVKAWYDQFQDRFRQSPSEVAGRMDSELAIQKVATVTKEEASPTKVTTSRIRVQLSRPLTWAEKEALETNNLDVHSRRINQSAAGFKFHVSDNKEHVWAEAGFGSRILYDLVAAAIEQHFVNVYPIAVRTFREYNGE